MANIDIKISNENLIKWSNMEDWVDGASSAPTEHTLSGAGASVAREATTIKQGTYSAAVTRSGANTKLYHDFPDYLDYAGRKVTFGMWVHASVASRARLSIDDGVASASNSSYHSGGGDWERLSITHNMSTSSTQMRLSCEVNTGNTTAYFDGGILVEGPDDIQVLTDIVDISDFSPSNTYKIQNSSVARRDGAKQPNSILDRKSISLTGMAIGTTATLARTSLDSLNNIMNSHRVKPNGDKEEKHLYLFDDRYIPVRVKRYEPDVKAALRVRPFKVNFDAVEPYSYYVQMLRSQTALSASPTTFTVTTNGNAISRPLITITNNGSNISSIILENLTSDQIFNYSGSLVTGNDLVLDTDLLTVKNNAVDDLANVTNDVQIILVPGANEFKITGIVSGTIKIDWFDRWY